MIGRLLNRFKDPIEIKLEEADEEIKEKKGESFEELEEKVEEYERDFKERIEKLRDHLQELEGYRDDKERAIVEDVVANIKEERENLIEDLSYPGDARELEKEMEAFINSFSTMSRKEAAVMKTIPVNKKMEETIEELGDTVSSYQNFLENRYSTKEKFEKIKEALKEKKELEGQLKEAENELNNIYVEELEEKVERKKQELDELKESDRWEEYKDLKKEIKQTKERKKKLKERRGKAVNKMERGLKKLVYRIENTGLEFNGDLKLLKKIRDLKKEKLAEISSERIEDTVEEAMRSIPEGLVEESQQQKFVEGVETLRDISGLREKIEEHEEEIENLREEIENHEVLDREEELAGEKKELKSELKNEEDRKEELEEKTERMRKEIEQIKNEIREEVKAVFDREVKFNKDLSETKA